MNKINKFSILKNLTKIVIDLLIFDKLSEFNLNQSDFDLTLSGQSIRCVRMERRLRLYLKNDLITEYRITANV